MVDALINPPEVSVVMGVHNGASRLRETVDSVLAQHDVSIEFIIINDGSTDLTAEILADFTTKDPRVRVLNQQNKGLTRALIEGCAMAQGRYIARQDCGDISLPGRLARQLAVMKENQGCVFTSCWTRLKGPGGEFLGVSKGTGIATSPMRVLSNHSQWGTVDGPSHHTSVMFRADAYRGVGGYRDAFYFGQDWDLWYRLAAHGDFLMVGQVLCEARLDPASISGSCKLVQDQFAAQSRLALSLRQSGLADNEAVEAARRIELRRPTPRSARRRLAEGNYFIARALARLHDRRARVYLMSALRLNPLHIRSWLALTQNILLSRTWPDSSHS